MNYQESTVSWVQLLVPLAGRRGVENIPAIDIPFGSLITVVNLIKRKKGCERQSETDH